MVGYAELLLAHGFTVLLPDARAHGASGGSLATYGLLERKFQEDSLLLDRILDRLKTGKENLDVILWAQDFGMPADKVLEILEALNVNACRLAHRFD